MIIKVQETRKWKISLRNYILVRLIYTIYLQTEKLFEFTNYAAIFRFFFTIITISHEPSIRYRAQSKQNPLHPLLDKKIDH